MCPHTSFREVWFWWRDIGFSERVQNDILRRYLSGCQVFCWNVESGCDYLGSVMSLADHYHEDCAFHAVFCPRCKLPVLRSDVVKHRECDCDPVSTKDFSMEQGSPRVPGSIAVALAKLLHNNNQLQALVNMLAESVSSECSSLRESLIVQAAKSNETSSCLSDCHKKLVEILNESKGCVNGRLSKEIYLYSNTASDSAAGGTKEVPSTNCLFQLHWYLENWGYLKTEAEIAKNGMPRVESTAAYMHGYNTVCVAAVDKLETEHYFLCSLKLVKGEHDSVLEWPFRKTCKISVIHPEDPSKTLSATIDDRKYKEKGLHPPGEKYGFPIRTAFITPVHVIENGGYATNGPLHLCLEILP